MLQRKAKRKGGLEFPAERTTSTLTRSRHGLRRGLVETIFVRLSKPFVYRIRSVFESARISNFCVFRMHSFFERMGVKKGKWLACSSKCALTAYFLHSRSPG